MKVLTSSGDTIEVEVGFPAPDKVMMKVTQGGEVLGFEIIDVEASYRFLNNLPPFEAQDK